MHRDEQDAIRGLLSAKEGHHPGHRADRIRKDHHALLGHPADPERRRQHRHGRGSGRVPAGREHRAGAGAREGGPHVRLGAPVDPPPGPRRRADRRDPRPGDGADRAAGVAHRPPGALDAAHQRRAQRGDPAGGHGDGAVQDRLGAARGGGAAAHAPALSASAGRRAPRRCPSAPRASFPRARHSSAPWVAPTASQTGYRGRFSIMEVLALSSEIERRIGQGATADQIAEAARTAGMRSLWESGLRHVLAGESTIEELLRVTDVPQEADAPGRAGGSTRRREGWTWRGSRCRAKPGAHRVARASGLVARLHHGDGPARRAGHGRGRWGRGARKGNQVLLVEDEDQLRRVMKDLLEREGTSSRRRATGCRRSTRWTATLPTSSCWT